MHVKIVLPIIDIEVGHYFQPPPANLMIVDPLSELKQSLATGNAPNNFYQVQCYFVNAHVGAIFSGGGVLQLSGLPPLISYLMLKLCFRVLVITALVTGLFSQRVLYIGQLDIVFSSVGSFSCNYS